MNEIYIHAEYIIIHDKYNLTTNDTALQHINRMLPEIIFVSILCREKQFLLYFIRQMKLNLHFIFNITDNLDFCCRLYLKFSKIKYILCYKIRKQTFIFSEADPAVLGRDIETSFMFSNNITMIIKLHVRLIKCQFITTNRRQSVRLTACTTSISASSPATLPSSLQRRRLSQTPN